MESRVASRGRNASVIAIGMVQEKNHVARSDAAAQKPAAIQQRPVPTLGQVKTFAQAMFSGKFAASDVVAQRMAICRKCDKLRVTPTGVVWCGACGCRVSRKDREITNLAAYEENLPKWGCKHPLRKKGKGWGAISGQLSTIAIGVPPKGSAVPRQVSAASLTVPGAPPKVPGVAREVPGAPLEVLDAPRKVSGVPPDGSGAPLEVSGARREVSGVPPEVPDVPRTEAGATPFSGGTPLEC